MRKMSGGDRVDASCRQAAPSQPVEHGGIDVHNTRCVYAPLAQWFERWGYAA